MRAVLVAMLAPAFLLPAMVGAEGPIIAHAEGFDECVGFLGVLPPMKCGIYARANWTVEACDDSSCTVRLDTHSNAWAVQPGLLRMDTFSYPPALGGNACLGPKLVSDQVNEIASCHRVCETYTVSWTASCVGSLTAKLNIGAGWCTSFDVLERFNYDEYLGGGGVFWFVYVCRAEADGVPYFEIY